MKFKTPEMWILACLLLLDAISTFDGFVTHRFFGYWTSDLNPLVNYLVLFVEPWTLVFFFIVSFGLCIAVNEIAKRKGDDAHLYARGMFAFFIIFEFFAVFNNYFVTNDIIQIMFGGG